MLHYAGTLGVKEFHFIGTFKVEKSYWDSPFLEPDFLNQEMRLALEQCVDTVPWQIHFHRFFFNSAPESRTSPAPSRIYCINRKGGGFHARTL